jgi:hypothetical protein
VFWSIIDDHPLCRHQQAYADFSAQRLSDVISGRRLAATRVYAEWFAPLGTVAETGGRDRAFADSHAKLRVQPDQRRFH